MLIEAVILKRTLRTGQTVSLGLKKRGEGSKKNQTYKLCTETFKYEDLKLALYTLQLTSDVPRRPW